MYNGSFRQYEFSEIDFSLSNNSEIFFDMDIMSYSNSRNFALLIFACLIFVVIYYLQFQEAVNILCSKNSFKLNFRVFNLRGFFQAQIIKNHDNFQNCSTCVPGFLSGFEARESKMEICNLVRSGRTCSSLQERTRVNLGEVNAPHLKETLYKCALETCYAGFSRYHSHSALFCPVSRSSLSSLGCITRSLPVSLTRWRTWWERESNRLSVTRTMTTKNWTAILAVRATLARTPWSRERRLKQSPHRRLGARQLGVAGGGAKQQGNDSSPSISQRNFIFTCITLFYTTEIAFFFGRKQLFLIDFVKNDVYALHRLSMNIFVIIVLSKAEAPTPVAISVWNTTTQTSCAKKWENWT